MSTSPILQFLFATEWNVLSEALNIQPVHEQISALSAVELSSLLKDKKACLILTSVRGKNDLVQLATMVKILKGNRDCITKIVVINFSGNKQIEKAIAKLGIQDVIEEKINTKALKFKIEFWFKALNVQLKNNIAAKEVKTLKAAENQANKFADKKNPDHIPVWTEPLDCENDIWILRNDNDCKKILTRWLVKIMGPSPYIGTWNEVPNRTGYWKFEIKPEAREEFMSSEGNWYFKGDQKPDFIWKENTWLITGSSFDLFHQGQDSLQSRVKLENRQLTISKNSDFAKTKEEIITNSFDKDLVFKKEAKLFGGTEVIEGIETEKLKSLSGKGKTEQISQKDLQGKGSTDQITQKDLTGKGGTSDLSSDPLALDLKNNSGDVGGQQLSQKSSTSHSSSTMAGKVSKEEAITDNESRLAKDKHRDGAQLGIENKNKNHEKYLRGHNEAEKYEASDTLGKKGEKSPLESTEGMSGKSNTDKINGHLGGLQKEQEVKAPVEDALDGKSSTDKIDSNMRGPQKEREVKAPVQGKDGLSGSQKEREVKTKQEAKDALDGKSSTDKLNSHMGGATSKKESEQHPDLEKERLGTVNENRQAKEKALKEASVNGKVQGHFKDNTQSGKSKAEFDKSGLQESATLYSLAKAREDKLKNNDANSDDEEEIRQATEDAKIECFLMANNKCFNCNLDDFFEGKLIFTTSDDGLAAEEKINLDLSFQYQKKDTKIAIEASIKTVEKDDEGNNYVTVGLTPKDVQTFESFMRLYQTRQENVDVFLKKVKGL